MAMEEKVDWANKLEGLMAEAGRGAPLAIRDFYNEVSRGDLVVPERSADPRLTAGVEYPNPFLTVLGVKVEARVLVPIFTRPELISQWCGMTLPYRSMSLGFLAKLIPPDWWACLNPGQEVEKEFSPWELERLQSGHIEEILSDIAENSEELFFTVAPVIDEQYNHLKSELIEAAKIHPEIRRMYLFQETKAPENEEDLRFKDLVVGVIVDKIAAAKVQLIADKILASGRIILIGSTTKLRLVWAQEEESSMVAKLLSRLTPIYESPIAEEPGLIVRGMKFFTRHFR